MKILGPNLPPLDSPYIRTMSRWHNNQVRYNLTFCCQLSSVRPCLGKKDSWYYGTISIFREDKYFERKQIVPWPLSVIKSKDDIGITIRPTIRSATARLMMNMLDTDWSLFSVLMAEWSTLIGRDPSRYCALIGIALLCWHQGLCHNNTHPYLGHFVPFSVLLWHDKWLPCTERIYYAIKTQKRQEIPQKGSFGCLEVCLYGIIELASVTQ